AISITLRRSKLSAIAPETSENSIIGRAVDACTSATISADEAMSVIIHAAPTVWISDPKFDARLAIQMARKVGCLNGEREAELESTMYLICWLEWTDRKPVRRGDALPLRERR